jgi:hypothetical protein
MVRVTRTPVWQELMTRAEAKVYVNVLNFLAAYPLGDLYSSVGDDNARPAAPPPHGN